MAEINTETTHIPKLRVSDKTKRANDFEHTKRVIDHYISCVSFVDEIINADVRDVRLFYEAYNNRLPDAYFRYVVNPLNSTNNEYTNWPARLRPYSIIRPNIDLLEGEYEKRPFSFAVKVHNADAVNIHQDAIYQDILKSLEQQFINYLNEKGQETGVPTQDVELPDKIKAAYQSNYRDKRAEIGEAALNIIIDQQQIEEKLKRLFRDWLIAGECYSYKGIRGGRMIYERVSPLDIDYDKSPDCEYIEDGQWVVRRFYMTPAEITDNFYEELKEDDIDLIEDENGHMAFRPVGNGMLNTLRDDRDLRRTKVPVFHCVWKYFIKVGILSYPNPMTGELETIEVPETYKPSEGENVEWYWVREVWEGYRIGAGVRDSDKGIYLGIKPVEGQRSVVNNISMCKLPYNGKKFSDTHSQNVSVAEMGLAYETLHRILHFQMEKTIAKSKGKIIIMDQNAIPKSYGWNEEKFFYWADATGWALVDRNQPGADKTFNQYAVLDMGLYQHINNLIELMTYVKNEWDELLGITRQRKGQVQASDTATGTQTAVQQSTVISEKVFSRFEEFTRSEMQGLLDLSKIAWRDGYQQVYQGDDLRTTILNIDPGEYSEAEMGVYVSRSPRDLQNLEIMRQQVQAFAQNGVGPSSVVDILQARSLSKLRTILQEFEQKSIAAQQGVAQQEQEGAERLEMIRGQFEELKGLVQERLINVEYDRKEEIEHIKGAYQTYKNVEGTGDNNANGVPDALEVRAQFADEAHNAAKLNIEQQKVAIQARQKDRELDIKERELTVRKDIADKQASVALKNKVAGEKSKPKK